MTPFRHALSVLLVTLPLLLLAVLPRGGGWWVLGLLLWLAVVLSLASLQWRRIVRPLAEISGEIGARSGPDARWLVRDLKESTAACTGERTRMAELLEDISASLGEGLLVVGSDLRLRLLNPVARRFCGSGEVQPGAHLLEVLRDPKAVAAIESAAGGGRPQPLMVENPRGLWEIQAFPIREGGAVVLVSDVAVVRRASELRQRFVQDLSHELRSPLAVLQTTVEALEDEVSPELAKVLIRQVARLDRLTRELYELASIESGQRELQLEAQALLPLVREVVRDHRPQAQRRDVELRVQVPEELTAWFDRTGLRRVLGNLLDNAIKYNRKGGWVEIRAALSGDRVSVRVSDSGEGIPAGELKAVTQRFYRIDRARTPGHGGLGLGLAIVKHMVQQMGGTLEIDSREQVGTRVTLTLGRGQPESDSSAAE